MGNVTTGMTMSLDGFVKDRDRNFALLYSACDELMSEGIIVSTSDCKLQAGGVTC